MSETKKSTTWFGKVVASADEERAIEHVQDAVLVDEPLLVITIRGIDANGIDAEFECVGHWTNIQHAEIRSTLMRISDRLRR